LFREQGQSPWLDNLKRGYLVSGELAGMVERGIRGITSNPTIFQKAISASGDYDKQFEALTRRHESVEDAYWDLVIDDIEHALERYADVIEAYLSGLEAYDGDLAPVHSVASFFVSRVDTEVDRRLNAIGTPDALALRGKAAVAQAKLAYQLFLEQFSGARWQR